MLISGGSTQHRRKKRSSERKPRHASAQSNNTTSLLNTDSTANVETLQTDPPLAPKKKRGAPRKRRVFNFHPKPSESPSPVPSPSQTPATDLQITNPRRSQKKSCVTMISTVRTRSAVADAKPTRQSKPRDFYVAKPSTPIKGGPKNHHWPQQKTNLLNAISNLESSQRKY